MRCASIVKADIIALRSKCINNMSHERGKYSRISKQKLKEKITK